MDHTADLNPDTPSASHSNGDQGDESDRSRWHAHRMTWFIAGVLVLALIVAAVVILGGFDLRRAERIAHQPGDLIELGPMDIVVESLTATESYGDEDYIDIEVTGRCRNRLESSLSPASWFFFYDPETTETLTRFNSATNPPETYPIASFDQDESGRGGATFLDPTESMIRCVFSLRTGDLREPSGEIWFVTSEMERSAGYFDAFDTSGWRSGDTFFNVPFDYVVEEYE
jgi:hypothetical protein